MTRNDYQLLKLVGSVSLIRGRKKLQKLIFIMNHLGFQIEDRFFMHYYGPYSADLALQIDGLVEKRLIEEKKILSEYAYRITPDGEKQIELFEKIMVDSRYVSHLNKMAEKFKEFQTHNTFPLELASTILFWTDWGKNYAEAVYVTETQKNVKRTNKVFREAIEIFHKVNSVRNFSHNKLNLEPKSNL